MAPEHHGGPAPWSSEYGVTDLERKRNRRVAVYVPMLPLAAIVAFGAVVCAGLALTGAALRRFLLEQDALPVEAQQLMQDLQAQVLVLRTENATLQERIQRPFARTGNQ